jgi:hypothetical protein
MTLVDDLKAARALIDTPEKWIKGRMGDGLNARCALGACYVVDACEKTLPAIYEFGGIPHGFRLAEFNDLYATTHNDILALFDRAIDAATLSQQKEASK